MSSPSLSLVNLSSIDISKTFPVAYSQVFSCSENSLGEAIEKVAAFVSKVYATFPKLNEEGRSRLREEGVWLHSLDQLPPETECEDFEKALKLKIITSLKKEECSDCSLNLSTDYYPEGTLRRVCEPIFKQTPQLGFLFPYKTCTRIYLMEEKSKLYLRMDFKGPSFFPSKL